MCVGVLSACLSVHHVSAECPQKLQEGVRSHETGRTDVRHCVDAGN